MAHLKAAVIAICRNPFNQGEIKTAYKFSKCCERFRQRIYDGKTLLPTEVCRYGEALAAKSSNGSVLQQTMATIAIPIHSIERRMRGGAQALLVRDGIGNAYVAKCVGNPQGTRTLINEWIVSRLLKHLRVSTPAVHAIRIERGIPGDGLLEFQIGKQRIPIAEGVHFGSLCPVNPAREVIFDHLPRRLLKNVVNLPDLVLAFVFDKWVNQTDSRQAIFIRERGAGDGTKFRAYLIDHGLSFGGSRWELCEGGLNGLYHDRSVYEAAATEPEYHAAVDRIDEIPENSLTSIEDEIPEEWLQTGDREEMTRLVELLCDRRVKLHHTIDRALRQLEEAGIVIPKAADRRQLLGTLLLLACMSRSLSPTRTSIAIEVSVVQNVETLQTLGPWRPACLDKL